MIYWQIGANHFCQRSVFHKFNILSTKSEINPKAQISSNTLYAGLNSKYSSKVLYLPGCRLQISEPKPNMVMEKTLNFVIENLAFRYSNIYYRIQIYQSIADISLEENRHFEVRRNLSITQVYLVNQCAKMQATHFSKYNLSFGIKTSFPVQSIYLQHISPEITLYFGCYWDKFSPPFFF